MPQFDDRLSTNKRLRAFQDNEEERLLSALAEQNGYRYIDLKGLSLNPEAITVIPEEAAKAAMLVAFDKQQKKLSVAVRNPNNPETKRVLEGLNDQWQVTVYMCSTKSLEHAWKRYADHRTTVAVKQGVLDIDPTEIVGLTSKLTSRDKVTEFIKEIRTVNTARRISTTLEAIFAGAIALSASDIHIEPEETGIRLRYRLDGVLHDVVDLDRSIYDRLASRLKLLAGLLLNVKNEAQDGRFTFELGEKKIEVRTSVIPGSSGESIVMRLLDPTVASFSMDQLGLNQTLYDLMKRELARPNGMIITTGPTGSGKTTALYAFLREAHTPEVKIITIEDPVEYKVDNIVQTQVEEDYTFASGLRSVLRQDPDIIMVGEIRDSEVAETAVQAAQTGHLVFSTLHTNNAAGAFSRLIDLGVDDRMIGNSINVVLGQRLVRILCPHCKTTYEASPDERTLIETILAGHPHPPQVPEPLTLYKPAGCVKCSDTGFLGRQGIFEAIKIDTAVEEAVIRDPREHVILEAASAQGIPTMPEDGIEKVLQGTTSLDELRRVIDLTATRNAPATPDDDAVTQHTV
ncbi:MAG: GspE/PulE family protein [Candidatus Paceibacterota bacterium]